MSDMSQRSAIRYVGSKGNRFAAQIITVFAAFLTATLVFAGCSRGAEHSANQTGAEQKEGPARVSGVVTASDTQEPVPYVQVVFFDLSGNQVGPPGNTDLSGKYSVELPAGAYVAVANIINPSHPLGWNGLAPGWNNGRPVKSYSDFIALAPGDDRTLDFKLARLRSCKGRIALQGASQVPQGSIVSAIDGLTGEHFADAPIDSAGSYEIQLPDGEWSLAFSVAGYVQSTAFKASVAGAPVEFPIQTLKPAA